MHANHMFELIKSCEISSHAKKKSNSFSAIILLLLRYHTELWFSICLEMDGSSSYCVCSSTARDIQYVNVSLVCFYCIIKLHEMFV